MEIRWRRQELIFVLILLLSKLLTLGWEWYQSAPLPPGVDPAQRFAENSLSFHYGINVFLPRSGMWVLLLLLYLTANFVLLPILRQLFFPALKKGRLAVIAKFLLGWLALTFTTALLANGLTYLGRPHFFNYGGYGFLASFGYNDAPLSDLSFGLRRAGELLLTITAVLALREWLLGYLGRPGPGREFRVYLTNQLSRLGFVFVLVTYLVKPFHWAWVLLIFCAFAWVLYRQNREKLRALWQVQQALIRTNADLQFLRSQINPHFLFNTLNTLYGSAIKEQAEHTATGIQLLGDMMRFILRDNQQELIPLEKEVDYLCNYLALQKLRLGDAANVELMDNLEEVRCPAYIPPMLFIPLVENAFKHGISFSKYSWIHIELNCSPSQLTFEVHNSAHPRSETDPEQQNHGIGLRNVQDRLKLLYPQRHEFDIKAEPGSFRVRIILQEPLLQTAKNG